jgi:hypothetical protein
MRHRRSTGRLPRGGLSVLSLAIVVGLLASGCGNSTPSANAGGGVPSYSVNVQKFRFHGMPTSIPSGDLIIGFSNRESLPITHELVLVSLPSGKSASDVTKAAKSGGRASEDGWLHFGEIPDVNTGATKAQVFELPAGTYAFACWQVGNLGGGHGAPHAARGMVFQFTVH